jgi:hypothetical protein
MTSTLQSLGERIKEGVHLGGGSKNEQRGEESQQQQTSGSRSSWYSGGQQQRLNPGDVGIILCGYPNELAVCTAKELTDRGCKILLAVEESTERMGGRSGPTGETWTEKLTSFMGGGGGHHEKHHEQQTQHHTQQQQHQQPQQQVVQGGGMGVGSTTMTTAVPVAGVVQQQPGVYTTGGVQQQQQQQVPPSMQKAQQDLQKAQQELAQATMQQATTVQPQYVQQQQQPQQQQQQQQQQETTIQGRISTDPAMRGAEVISQKEPGLHTRMKEIVKSAHDRGMYVIGIDVSEHNPSANMFQQCDIPFVLNTRGNEGFFSGMMRSRSLCVIDEDFNKYDRAMEECWEMLGKRFPGLLREGDWEVEGKECLPETEAKEYRRSTDRMIEAMDRLMARNVGSKAVQMVRDKKEAEKGGVPREHLDNHMYQEFKFKTKDGKACIKFEQAYMGDCAEAEGIADCALFLAHKSAMNHKPRMWRLTEVMETKLQHHYGSWIGEDDQQKQQQQQRQGGEQHRYTHQQTATT